MNAFSSVLANGDHGLGTLVSSVDNYLLENGSDVQARISAFLDEHMPWPYVRCGGNLKGGGAAWSARKERARALTERWISFNTTTHWNVITLDCDHQDWPHYLQRLREQGQPEPTMVLRSRRSGHAQVTWKYAKGKNKASAEMRRLHEGIYGHLRESLVADPQFKQYLGYNPLHDYYEVVLFTGKVYEFRDFIGPAIEWSGDAFVLAPQLTAQHEGYRPGIPAVPKGIDEAIGPKGSRVFDIGRQRVYRMRCADYAGILAIYEDVAAELRSPIKYKQLQGMARRSAQWMAARPEMLGKPAREERDIDHRVMTREAEQRGQVKEWHKLDVTSKRTLAAERTNAGRSITAIAAIAAAVDRLWAVGTVITQAAVASEADISERQVRRVWNDTAPYAKQDSRSNPFSPPGQGMGSLSLRGLAAASRERARVAKAEEKQAKAEAERAAVEAARQTALAVKAAVAYRALAAAMLKPGATPQPVPPGPMDEHPEVRAARGETLAAHRDAARRTRARRERIAAATEAEERRSLFEGMAAAGDTAGFETWMVAAEKRWDWAEQSVEAELRHVRVRQLMQRAVALKRYRREWDEAVARAALTDAGRAVRDAICAVPRPCRYRPGDALRTSVDGIDRIAAGIPVPLDDKRECQARLPVIVPPVPALSWPAGIPMPSFIRERLATQGQ